MERGFTDCWKQAVSWFSTRSPIGPALFSPMEPVMWRRDARSSTVKMLQEQVAPLFRELRLTRRGLVQSLRVDNERGIKEECASNILKVDLKLDFWCHLVEHWNHEHWWAARDLGSPGSPSHPSGFLVYSQRRVRVGKSACIYICNHLYNVSIYCKTLYN